MQDPVQGQGAEEEHEEAAPSLAPQPSLSGSDESVPPPAFGQSYGKITHESSGVNTLSTVGGTQHIQSTVPSISLLIMQTTVGLIFESRSPLLGSPVFICPLFAAIWTLVPRRSQKYLQISRKVLRESQVRTSRRYRSTLLSTL